MLTKAVRLNSNNALDAAKQLLIWALSKKQKFHISCTNSYYSRYNNRPHFRRSKSWEFDDELQQRKANFNIDELKTYKKNFYEPHPDVLNRSKEEIENFHKKHDIQIFGSNRHKCPPPIFSFEELDMPLETTNVLRNMNYVKPTPIQAQAWPLALSGLNMVGISQTGSGKTLGFMLPALLHIQNQPPLDPGEGPIALVIAPTRELTQQIYYVTQMFSRSARLRCACAYGGANKHFQREKLENVHICIATPGRLLDFLTDGTMNLSRCTYFVLDEADRLLDMGFEPQIRSIMNQIRPDHQTTMWSATWPREVRNLAETFLKDYIGVKFGSMELAANPKITQRVHFCKEGEKQSLLSSILEEIRKEKDNKTLIFTKTKRTAEYVFKMLRSRRLPVDFIHGDLSQHRRDTVVKDFKRGYVRILVGTSVVARGLDITDIRYVINFDFPKDIEEYIHVIGRTARNENMGTSHTFFTTEDFTHSRDLVRILESAEQEVPEFLREAEVEKDTGFSRNSRGKHSYQYRRNSNY